MNIENVLEKLEEDTKRLKELFSLESPDLSLQEKILWKEVLFWHALARKFNQKTYIDSIQKLANIRLKEKGLPKITSLSRVHEYVRTFLKNFNIEYVSGKYILPQELSLKIIFSFSQEELLSSFKRIKYMSGYNLTLLKGKAAFLAGEVDFFEEFKKNPSYYNTYNFEKCEREVISFALDTFQHKEFATRIPPKSLFWFFEKAWIHVLLAKEINLHHLIQIIAETIEKLSPSEETYFHAACYAVLAADFERALNWAARTENPYHLYFIKSLRAYFYGDFEGALDNLVRAEQEYFSVFKRKKYFLTESFWAFWAARIFSLATDPSLKTKAASLLNYILKNFPELRSYTRLIDYYRFLKNKPCYLSWTREIYHFNIVVLCWMIKKLDFYPSDARILIDLALELEKRGYLFYAREIMFALTLKNVAEAHKWLNQKGLFRKVKEKPPWERFLKELKLYLKTYEKKEETRLVWLVDTENLRLEPREQKKRANGTWTAGRPVAIERLREGEYPGLSSHDTRITKYIGHEVVRYRRGVKALYYLKPEAILALAGHPLVFDMHTLEPLEVVEARPELILRSREDKIFLELNPRANQDLSVYITREGRTVKVYRLDELYKRLSALIGEHGIAIPRDAEKEVEEILALLAKNFVVISDLCHEKAEDVPPDQRLYLILKPRVEGLLLKVRVKPFGEKGPSFNPGRGRKTLTINQGERLIYTTRDFAREKKLFSKVSAIIEEIENILPCGEAAWEAEDLEASLELVDKLSELEKENFVILWPEGKPYNVVRPQQEIFVKINTLKDWFEVEGNILVDGEEIPFEKLIGLLRNKKSRFIPLDDKRFLALKENLKRSLVHLATLAKIKENRVRIHPLRALVALREEGLPLSGDSSWAEFAQKIEKALSLEPNPPKGLAERLRPYQLEGFSWLRRLYEMGFGACLADDMGLGKTIQTLALLLDRAQEGPSLVVAPASVVSVWEEESFRFAPGLEIIKLDNPSDREKLLKNLGPGQLVLASYGLLQQKKTSELLAKVSWNIVVLDEAQHIKNYRTKRAMNAFKLNARFRMATTGTPIENRLEELWTLFRFLNPGLLGSLEEFREKFVLPIEKHGDKEARRLLKRLIRPFVLRRIKEEVLDELPPRTEMVLKLDFSPEERELYETLRLEALKTLEKKPELPQTRIEVLARLLRMRQLCLSPSLVFPEKKFSGTKLNALIELLRELLSGGHRVLVFSQFVSFLRLIEKELKKEKISFITLEGGLSRAKRKELVKRFQQREFPVFLLSLKAGGVGLNLTAADYVILTDPWWNPAVEDQAADRAHRLGQHRPVTICRLIMKESIEEKILALHQHKKALGKELLAETDSSSLSFEELKALLEN